MHDDSVAHAAANALEAQAFTTHSDIYFGLGARTTDDLTADYLLAHELAQSDTDEWGRFGMSLGGGAALRGHWADEDNDGTRSYGFGADIGPFSFDVKSEDPMRTAMRLGGANGMIPMLPKDNLTKITGEGLSNYADQARSVMEKIPGFMPQGMVPGLDVMQGIGLPDISMPSVEDILSFL